MLIGIIGSCDLLARGPAGTDPIIAVMGLPTHAELVGWTGTILSIATAFTGGFVMIYQRIQRARRDDRTEWMKLRHGSLQAQLEQANNDLAEARDEILFQATKLDVVTKQNSDQLEEIIELTRHITRLGALIGRLPQRLGVNFPAILSVEPTENSIAALDQTVQCLKGLVEQLRETTQVLSRLARYELERPNAAPARSFGQAGAEEEKRERCPAAPSGSREVDLT